MTPPSGSTETHGRLMVSGKSSEHAGLFMNDRKVYSNGYLGQTAVSHLNMLLAAILSLCCLMANTSVGCALELGMYRNPLMMHAIDRNVSPGTSTGAQPMLVGTGGSAMSREGKRLVVSDLFRALTLLFEFAKF